ncbi:phosphoribosyltransferase [Porphyromonas levii]|uniref:phosphoribosyltransferase n=1 Tax=Porphyromonas levii TaxID=28114 RepID=UPI001B8D7D34|nr:phosphoribosyltransferase family protein [Porphyromonas levii]MBR8713973.1 Hypoxanthine-guanine phosphoribosyltransferase [Porphyromonas levii]MBR8715991.1 Hypoxanthine-guanine phosphoribosyltransferase [Porphyromonas levii]MBR8728529.1 Hypoxanthine-guanine phosphoribosyltransferase [Porphyromonas levii]MBR8730196.1 Hypoxanthine-guanine phosphoribosyltransferase [Porphyromonas levii]MBR8736854.1 Hypoxanthine-guanine phosphoribosyltransferase [Porphyromonas levii]
MKESIEVHGLTFVPYLSEEELRPEVKRMAQDIVHDLGAKNPLFVCILNGAFMFTAELARQLDSIYDIAFAKYSSYDGLSSTGTLHEIMKPTAPMEGRVVVILEDLIDTGFTVTELRKLYKQRGATEVYVAAMLSKPGALAEGAEPAEYVGKEIPNDFILGCGLDYNGGGRMLRDIYVLKK